jgi:hypothetical protein
MRRSTLALALTLLPAATALLLVVLLAAEFPLAALAHQDVLAGSGGAPIWLPVPFGLVGSVLAWRKPRNRLGWILLGLAVTSALAEDGSFYVVACYRLHQALPFGWVALLAQPAWSLAIILIGLAVLLFPDGHLPSPRLRWLLWTYVGTSLVWMVSAYGFTISALVRHDVHVDPAGNLQVLSHPTGSAAWWGAVQNAVFAVLAASWLMSVAGQAASYRRSSGERRQQLKWLLGGSVVTSACLLLGISLPGPGAARVVGSVSIVAAVFALPVCMAVAVLKYRLYDIDRLISRTVAYAIVTGLLVGVYVGLVLAAEAIGSRAPVRVALATLAAAALFSPLRRRVQHAVDRRFNRARYDADKTVAAFAARLQDQVELDAVRADLTDVVQTVLEPTHVGIWIAR